MCVCVCVCVYVCVQASLKSETAKTERLFVKHFFLLFFVFFAKAKGKKPLFVQFVLENIWSVYDAVLLQR